MRRFILLDTGVLDALVLRKPDIRAWIDRLGGLGVEIRIPAICYYEVRRGLVRKARDASLDEVGRRQFVNRLDSLEQLCVRYRIEPIDLKTIRLASELWADARLGGYATADDASLDADVILAATAKRLERGGRDVVVVTTNVRHLSRYVRASTWDSI